MHYFIYILKIIFIIFSIISLSTFHLHLYQPPRLIILKVHVCNRSCIYAAIFNLDLYSTGVNPGSTANRTNPKLKERENDFILCRLFVPVVLCRVEREMKRNEGRVPPPNCVEDPRWISVWPVTWIKTWVCYVCTRSLKNPMSS